MTLTVTPVVTDADLEAFIRVPSRVYRDFPSYVAPLTIDRQTLYNPKKASFFKHGKGKYWIARRDDELMGRISAQIDDAQPEDAFGDGGLFGCLDAIDDVEVTRALFAAAEGWLWANGRGSAVGPFSLNMNGEPGLLVEGQDEPPLTLVAWHPAYLQRHMDVLGYAGCKDLHYWRLSDLPEKLKQLQGQKKFRSTMQDVTIRNLDMKHAARDLEIIRLVYNDAWKDNWGFVPLQPADVEAISKDLKPFIRPKYGMIVERQGKPLAVALMFPNLFEVTADIGADPSLIGWAKIAYRAYFHRFRTGFIVLFGVLSEIRNTVGGAVIAMSIVDEFIRRFGSYGDLSGWIEAGWVLDNNTALQKILMQYGFQKARTLRLFQKTLIPEGAAT